MRHIKFRNAILQTSLLLCAVLVFASTARAQSLPLDSMMAKLNAPAPRALGSWKYALVSGGKAIGLLTVSVATEQTVTGSAYRFIQTGDFMLSASQSQLLSTTAKMKPDLSLTEYEKTSETIENGASVKKEKTKAAAGTLTVSTTRQTTGLPVYTSTIRKPGPVYYAFGAAWVFLHSIDLKPGLTTTFYSYVPGQERVLDGRIQAQGTVKAEDGSNKKYLRVSVFNGESEMLFDVDELGRVASYGPATGEVVFMLLED